MRRGPCFERAQLARPGLVALALQAGLDQERRLAGALREEVHVVAAFRRAHVGDLEAAASSSSRIAVSSARPWDIVIPEMTKHLLFDLASRTDWLSSERSRRLLGPRQQPRKVVVDAAHPEIRLALEWTPEVSAPDAYRHPHRKLEGSPFRACVAIHADLEPCELEALWSF